MGPDLFVSIGEYGLACGLLLAPALMWGLFLMAKPVRPCITRTGVWALRQRAAQAEKRLALGGAAVLTAVLVGTSLLAVARCACHTAQARSARLTPRAGGRSAVPVTRATLAGVAVVEAGLALWLLPTLRRGGALSQPASASVTGNAGAHAVSRLDVLTGALACCHGPAQRTRCRCRCR